MLLLFSPSAEIACIDVELTARDIDIELKSRSIEITLYECP